MKARLPKGMGGGPGNMNSMIRQAQKMQEEMEAVQNELNESEFKAAAGGGAVEVEAPASETKSAPRLKAEGVRRAGVEGGVAGVQGAPPGPLPGRGGGGGGGGGIDMAREAVGAGSGR